MRSSSIAAVRSATTRSAGRAAPFGSGHAGSGSSSAPGSGSAPAPAPASVSAAAAARGIMGATVSTTGLPTTLRTGPAARCAWLGLGLELG
eukprot:scaffold19260_cov66-Phaeocystis_antarctica.AAC.4